MVGFKRRIKIYRGNHKGGKDATTLTFFEVVGHKEILQLNASERMEDLVMKKDEYIKRNNNPNNYHPTIEEIAEVQEREEKIAIEKEKQIVEEESKNISEEISHKNEMLIQNVKYILKLEKSNRKHNTERPTTT